MAKGYKSFKFHYPPIEDTENLLEKNKKGDCSSVAIVQHRFHFMYFWCTLDEGHPGNHIAHIDTKEVNRTTGKNMVDTTRSIMIGAEWGDE